MNNALYKHTLYNLLFIIILLGMIGVGYYVLVKKNTQVIKSPPPIAVQYATVKKVKWPKRITTTGTINGIIGIIIRSQAEGQVTKRLTKQGSMVKKGELVMQLNPQGLKGKLERDTAILKLSEIHLKELKPLVKEGAIPLWKFQQGQSTYYQASDEVAKTRKLYELSQIKAPISGRLGIYKVQIGDYVKDGQDLVNLEDTSKLRVDFHVPARFSKQMKKGETVLLQDSANNIIGKATIYAIESRLDSNNQTLHIRALVQAKKGSLITPGLFVRVSVLLNTLKPRLVVPETTLHRTPDGEYVYIVKNNRAKEVPVEVGENRNGLIEILSGLKEGEIIVGLGESKIHTGARLKNVLKSKPGK
jgi:membrane fusion protein (multidrug efflux system)